MVRPASRLDRVPSYAFLAAIAGLLALVFVLSWAAPDTFWNPRPDWSFNDAKCAQPPTTGEGFFFDHYWRPILCDEGYNVYNTVTWAVLLGLLLLWAYRLTTELREPVGTSLILAVVPFMVWGSVYRVLEDADLFAPYGSAQAAGPAGGGFLDHYLGVFFITPIIYVEIVFLAVGLLVWSRAAARVGQRQGLVRGLQFFALSLVAACALYVAWWASGPTYIRFVAHPVLALAAALVAFWIVARDASARGRINPHVGLGAWGLFFLLLGAYYVLVWMVGGVEAWRPTAADAVTRDYPLDPTSIARGLDWPVQWWVYLAAVLAPGLVAWATWGTGRVLGGIGRGARAQPRRDHGRLAAVLIGLVLVQALAVFLTMLGLRDLAQRGLADAWGVAPGGYVTTVALLAAGPAVILASFWAGRRFLVPRLGFHPALLYYATPVNLLMVFGQMIDAMMTSLGIDLYHYTEKHVLPGFLIETVEAWNLPAPLGDYPTALVMIPLKLLIVLLVVVAIDASNDRDLGGRVNLVGLVKLGIIMVGFSPGVRDAVRLAMAT